MWVIGTVMAVALTAGMPAFAQAPAQAPAAETPAALAEARAVVARLLPRGTYKTLMSSTMAPLMDQMGDSIGQLPLRQLAQLGGLSAEQATALDKVDVARVMAIYDPQWKERSRLQMRAMFTAMGEFFDQFEPELREAYARAFAHRFSAAELADLNRYFATPTGAKFAGGYMQMATDPAIIDATKAMMPRMMSAMPRFVEAAQKATAALPPPRRIEQLSSRERSELARALGVDAKQLTDPAPQP